MRGSLYLTLGFDGRDLGVVAVELGPGQDRFGGIYIIYQLSRIIYIFGLLGAVVAWHFHADQILYSSFSVIN